MEINESNYQPAGSCNSCMDERKVNVKKDRLYAIIDRNDDLDGYFSGAFLNPVASVRKNPMAGRRVLGGRCVSNEGSGISLMACFAGHIANAKT